MRGYRKWSIAAAGLLLGFIAALLGKLSVELAGLIGTIVTGYFAVNGYAARRSSVTQSLTDE